MISNTVSLLGAMWMQDGSELPSWLQAIVDFLIQVILEIPILILDIIEFILKAI